ncbi:MAG: hypothetical protein KDK99_14300 [Verrucomicrobiales bacterium]|nr:hypothetical protein [Verrucomicrobiales bacterium]
MEDATLTPGEIPDAMPPSVALRTRPNYGRWMVLLAGLALYAGVHLWLAGLLRTQTNVTDARVLGGDQKHNIKLALQTRPDLWPDFTQGVSEPLKRWLPHRTDGVVNPLWPWVAAWLADPDQTISGDDEVTAADRALFEKGRSFNIGLTLGFLLITGLACARVFSVPASLLVVFLGGLGALLPRAVYFQPEPLYYVFFTLTWIACIFGLLGNSLWVYSLIGVLSGLAYLAKGSVHPLLLAFIGVSTMRWFWGWLLAHWPGRAGTTQWVRRNHWFGLALLLFFHLMTISPRLADAREKFGDPMHSYPAYWMWFDDFRECYAWMGTYNSAATLESLPATERPSFKTYAATHTSEQIWQRLRDGVETKLTDLWTPGITQQNRAGNKPWRGLLEWRGAYLAGLCLLLLVVLASFWGKGMVEKCPRQCLHPEAISVTLFVVGSCIGLTLAYGWYSPIGRGDRFMLSLYLPLVLSLLWAAESVVRRAQRRGLRPWIIGAYHLALWVMLGGILWRVIQIVQNPVFKS